MTAQFRHWRRATGADGICRLVLDRADSSANTLSGEVLLELDAAIGEVERERPRGVIVSSAKSAGFILGADVKEFEQLTNAAEGARLAAQGQNVLARLGALEMPTVAAVNGFALGGGLELALACRYRVAVRGYERNLGLPEVQLGIHPGFGGTVRMVELLGAPRALELMLSGRSLSPVEAYAAGLVDRLVEADDLERSAVELLQRAPPPRRAPWYLRALNLSLLRPLIARQVRTGVARRARPEHYPAPYAILDLWLRHGAHGAPAYAAEAESIGKLLVGRTSKNLVRMFLLRERMRNLAPRNESVRRVHVVGAGVMGGDIAAWCAVRGLTVTLQDREMKLVEPAMQRAQRLFQKRLREPGAAAAARERLTVDLAADTVGSADLVIEAIVEDLDAKRELLRTLEPKLGADTLVATNTSSIRLEEMSSAFERPGRFVGLHFFNPVPSLPLVEVIHGAATDAATVQRALAFATQIGKLPLPCRSAPGFVVNRVLMPYMLEALRAHGDGHAFETIDAAATSFGMPMGPIELADKVGLDVALHVARILNSALPGETPVTLSSATASGTTTEVTMHKANAAATRLLEAKVAAGELGVKSGRGFYRYEGERPQKRRDFAAPDRDLEDRLILPLVNEAVACYDEGVIEDLDLLDAGVVFGTGFAPFTGGPVNYARQRGVDEVIARLEAMARRHGPRFTPRSGWRRLRPEA